MRSVSMVNKSLSRPILIFGVHKKWISMNALLSFPLLAASHFRFPAVFLGLGLFIVMHFITKMLTNYDVYLAELIKQNMQFNLTKFYPAIGSIAEN